MSRRPAPRSAAQRPAPRWRLLAPLALAGCVNPPTGQYLGGYQNATTGDVSRTSASHLGEISVEDQLGVESRYRANMRAVTTDSTTTSPDGGFDQTETVLQPSVDAVLAFATLRWVQGYELLQDQLRNSTGFSNDFTRSDVLQQLVWSPVGLPTFTFRFDGRQLTDDISVDTHDVRWIFEVDDVRGPFVLDYRAELRERTDDRNDIDRDQLEHLFRLSYQDRHLDGALDTSASVFINERDATETFSTGAVPLPPDQVFPIAGLAAVDDTPSVGVLPPVPGLIDGDNSVPTPINIGGLAEGGQPQWNIGVEFADEDTVTNLALLYTDQIVGPVFLPQYAFSVWSSDDNNLWTQVSGNTPFTFENAFSRFRILLPSVQARFLKLVVTQTPPLAGPIFVTELETFGPGVDGEAPTAGRADRTDSVRSFTTNLAWRPDATLSLGADVFAQTQRRVIDGDPNQDERRIDLGLTALWAPTRLMDLNLRMLSRDIDDPVRFDQDYLQLSGLFTLHPVDTLDVSLNLLDISQDRDAEPERDNTAARLRASAQLLKTLTADLAFEHNVLDDFINERRTVRDIISGSLIAQVTRDVDLTLELIRDDATLSGPGADLAPNPGSNRAAILFVYQPSNQLTTEARLQWRDDTGGDGLDQRYRIAWIPFPDGTFDVQFDYLHTVDGVFGNDNDIYQLISRWSISARVFLQLNYSINDPSEGERTDLATVSFNATF